MPSIAFKAIRRNSTNGNSASGQAALGCSAIAVPVATDTRAAPMVTWLAVTPLEASRRTNGRNRAWKRGFSS